MLTISGINLIGQLYQFRPHRDRQVRDHVFIIGNQVNPNRHRILTIGQIGLKGAIKLTRNKIPIWGFSNGIVPAVTTLRMGYPSVLLIIPTLLADDQASQTHRGRYAVESQSVLVRDPTTIRPLSHLAFADRVSRFYHCESGHSLPLDPVNPDVLPSSTPGRNRLGPPGDRSSLCN